ncbi:hypothetical protein [Streptomyces sp. NBC_01465]|uniref:hypothetical protein n=1 Tax=Streptomyces sp. NBC_01465 TaxID=2903878 RepID=UPI002E338D51|nr:hypothetical protein [Streptomyces sp. NBC_01465]
MTALRRYATGPGSRREAWGVALLLCLPLAACSGQGGPGGANGSGGEAGATIAQGATGESAAGGGTEPGGTAGGANGGGTSSSSPGGSTGRGAAGGVSPSGGRTGGGTSSGNTGGGTSSGNTGGGAPGAPGGATPGGNGGNGGGGGPKAPGSPLKIPVVVLEGKPINPEGRTNENGEFEESIWPTIEGQFRDACGDHTVCVTLVRRYETLTGVSPCGYARTEPAGDTVVARGKNTVVTVIGGLPCPPPSPPPSPLSPSPSPGTTSPAASLTTSAPPAGP